LRDTSVRVAAERYRSGEVSVNQTARLAGVGLGERLEIARKRNTTPQLTPDDPEADADAARDRWWGSVSTRRRSLHWVNSVNYDCSSRSMTG
jgi:hypothetical protein